MCLLRVWCYVPGVLGHSTPVHRCVRSLRCVACALSLASWLQLIGLLARCVVLLVRCPVPLGSCSPVCSLGALCCVCGVLGHLVPVQPCACLLCCVVCAVPRTTWLLFPGVHTRWAVLRARCSGPLGSCSPVFLLGESCCVCGVLGHLAPVHQCARPVCRVACAVSCATRRSFTGVLARCVVLRVRCPWPPGDCSPVCALAALCCVPNVQDHLVPVHRCARSLRCVVCVVSLATCLLFTGVLAWCAALRVQCPGPLGSCSLVCVLGVL